VSDVLFPISPFFGQNRLRDAKLVGVDGRFKCSFCGEMLDGSPLAWHSMLLIYGLRSPRSVSGDACLPAINAPLMIVLLRRGLVEIPVLDGDGPFAWGAWVSLSKVIFDRATSLWHDSNRVDEPAYFGWFCNSIPGDPETLHSKTAVHSREVGLRPLIELEATDHPLAVEQRSGITVAGLRAIAEQMHHSASENRLIQHFRPNDFRAGMLPAKPTRRVCEPTRRSLRRGSCYKPLTNCLHRP